MTARQAKRRLVAIASTAALTALAVGVIRAPGFDPKSMPPVSPHERRQRCQDWYPDGGVHELGELPVSVCLRTLAELQAGR